MEKRGVIQRRGRRREVRAIQVCLLRKNPQGERNYGIKILINEKNTNRHTHQSNIDIEQKREN